MFDRGYNLTDAQKCDILQTLTCDDCVKIEPNNNERYPDNEIYVFLKTCSIDVYGEDEFVKLYIKLYIQITPSYDEVVIISFHQEALY